MDYQQRLSESITRFSQTSKKLENLQDFASAEEACSACRTAVQTLLLLFDELDPDTHYDAKELEDSIDRTEAGLKEMLDSDELRDGDYQYLEAYLKNVQQRRKIFEAMLTGRLDDVRAAALSYPNAS